MPCLHGGFVRRALIRRHVVGNEIDVPPMLNPQGSALALVESDCLSYQIAIGDPAARRNLLFPPPIEQITGSRCAPETRLDLRGFPLDEQLSLFVARVVKTREIEPQTEIHIPRALFGRH